MRFLSNGCILVFAGVCVAASARAQDSAAAKRSVGAIGYTVDSSEIAASGARSLSELLQARVPGLSVLRPGGAAAQGAQFRLRGIRSFSFDSDPIVLVDGVRVDATQDATVIDVDVRTARLDDISPNDVARIDVLPGAAAASLYGPGAAGGALLISTKRGAAGLHVSGRAESTLGIIATTFPTNYRLDGINTSTGQPTRCVLLQVANATCTQTTLSTWNPLERASPLRAARSGSGNVALAGGIGQTTARVAVNGGRTLGVTSDDDDGRLAVRGNLDQRLGTSLELEGNAGYLRSSAALPVRGKWIDRSNVIANGLFGSGVTDTINGYRPVNYVTSTREHVHHSTVGGAGHWSALRWLRADAVYGRDQLIERDDQLTVFTGPAGAFPNGQYAAFDHTLTTFDASVAASYRLIDSSIVSRTVLGYQRLNSVLGAIDTLPQGGLSLTHVNSRSDGPWVRQTVAWGERVTAGVGARLEREIAFHQHVPQKVLKSADAGWVIGRFLRLDSLRLRAAYGEGTNWSPGNPHWVVSHDFTGALEAVLAADERTHEFEIGSDFAIGGLAHLSLSAFRADASHISTDWGVPAPAPGTPSGPLFQPVGKIRNDGVEVASTFRLLERRTLQWNATVLATMLRNRVRSLGDLPPLVQTYNITTVGSPVATYTTRGYTYSDANGDGLIGQNEVQNVSIAPHLAGSALPSREVSLSSSLTLRSRLTIAALVDYRGGQQLSNLSEAIRCLNYRNCRAVNDRSAPLADQARAVIGVDPYLQDASFMKLREVSVRWAIPVRAAGLLGRGATLTLAGRNLATWTRYPGMDPELNEQPVRAITRVDLAETPLPREFLLRLDFAR